MDKKIKLINKIYPWYSGLSNDLIFYIAINTIWLAVVKCFSPSQITFLFTISSLFVILFQVPFLLIIRKIGNTASIRVGMLLLFIASIILTFSNNYLIFCIASILVEVAFIFKMMDGILLKNNLEYQNKSDEYIKVRSKSNFIYSVSTAIITLFVGLLFKVHQYLPMILGIIICLICFVFSCIIFDIDEKNSNVRLVCFNDSILKFIPNSLKLFFLIFIFYGLVFGIIVVGQQNAKLLIQQYLFNFFDMEKVVSYVGFIVFISRFIRIITNYFYPKIYCVLKNKMSLLLTLFLILSTCLMLLGFYLDSLFIMSLGFSFFPSLREPVKIYSQNFILETFDKEYHKDSLLYLFLAENIGKFLFSLISSYFLIGLPLQYLFILLTIALLPIVYISIKIIRYSSDKNLK